MKSQLDLIQKLYAFVFERARILRFLEKYPFLVPMLIEAYSNIEKFFPHSLVRLAVVTDPEEFGTEQLTAFVVTNLGPDETIDALSAFDKKWWLKSLKRTQRKLCITLEFQ